MQVSTLPAASRLPWPLLVYICLSSVAVAQLIAIGRPWGVAALAPIVIGGSWGIIASSVAFKATYLGTAAFDPIAVTQEAWERVLAGQTPYGVGLPPENNMFPYGPLALPWWAPGIAVELIASIALLVVLRRAPVTMALVAGVPFFHYLAGAETTTSRRRCYWSVGCCWSVTGPCSEAYWSPARWLSSHTPRLGPGRPWCSAVSAHGRRFPRSLGPPVEPAAGVGSGDISGRCAVSPTHDFRNRGKCQPPSSLVWHRCVPFGVGASWRARLHLCWSCSRHGGSMSAILSR